MQYFDIPKTKRKTKKSIEYLLFVDSQLYGLVSEFRWEIGQISI